VGNIANNAFCAAYLDRFNGINAFVVNPHLKDSIATPQWEFPAVDFQQNSLLKTVDTWYIAGSWKYILGNWDGNSFFRTRDLVSRVKSLNPFLGFLKKKVKFVIPRRLRPFISNEVIYRFRKLIEPNLTFFFKEFDLVILYGPYNQLAHYISAPTVYVAFEHGTLENFCKGNFKYCRDALAGFKIASGILITNQGGLRASKEFGIPEEIVHKGPHPTIDMGIEVFRESRSKLLLKGSCSGFILAPSRQARLNRIDPGKGNEKIFTAFKLLLVNYPDIKLMCIDYGDDLMWSKKLIRRMGLEDSIIWLPIQTKYQLKKLISESICVIDQLNSPSYGNITADALLIGTPVLTSHNCEADQVHFGECAPVFSVRESSDIYLHVTNILKSYSSAQKWQNESTDWADKYLTSKVAFELRNKFYIQIQNEINL
jgi:glycosyltransferase involved in cell wall biosynthesis